MKVTFEKIERKKWDDFRFKYLIRVDGIARGFFRMPNGWGRAWRIQPLNAPDHARGGPILQRIMTKGGAAARDAAAVWILQNIDLLPSEADLKAADDARLEAIYKAEEESRMRRLAHVREGLETIRRFDDLVSTLPLGVAELGTMQKIRAAALNGYPSAVLNELQAENTDA